MAYHQRIMSVLLGVVLSIPCATNAATPVNSIVIFGDSLSDVGNTTHLLKSLRRDEHPAFLVAPLKRFVINKMTDFANDYYVPQAVLEAGIATVTDFFDEGIAPYMAELIARLKIVPLIPQQPYWEYRFSNGRVWNEYLAPMLSIPQTDADRYINKAFGGSWAATYDYQLTVWNLIRHPLATIKGLVVGKLIPPSLGLATQAYLLEHQKLNSDTLYFFFSGANDYLNVLKFEANYDPLVMSKYIDNVLDAQASSVMRLKHAGARRFIIMGLPHLGDTPRYINTTDREVLNNAVEQHNMRLQHRIAQWQSDYPEADFMFVDIQSYFNKAISTPKQFGFANTKEACIDVVFPVFSAFANSPFANNYVLQYAQVLQYQDKRLAPGEKNVRVCNAPDSYLFWDEVHPSTQAHKYLAYELCLAMKEHGYDTLCRE